VTTKYLAPPASGGTNPVGNGNPSVSVAYFQATPLGTSPQTYKVVERLDGTTLVASTSYPMRDACIALRARGESKNLNVTLQTLLNNGGWADGASALLGGRDMQMVGGGSVQAGA
jgi:hypothetical protein